MSLTALPAFTDNNRIIDDGEAAIAVDPGELEPVAAALHACRPDRRRF